LDIQWYYYLVPVPGEQLSRKVIDTGWYGIHIEDTLGCWGRDTAWVTHDLRVPGPEIECRVNGGIGNFIFYWPSDTKVETNEVSTDGGLTWFPASNGNSHTVTNIQDQKVILGRGLVPSSCGTTEITNSMECPDEVFPPNVITPNGDGLNDMFEVRGLDLFDQSTIEIFDRWGNVVFSSDNYDNSWNGDEQPEGTYYYIIEVDDPQHTIHKGVITILR
jgi:gliding motility-associated-like protein